METDEPLETGYGPATPRGDNLTNDYAQGMADAYQRLGEARGHRVEASDDLLLSDGGSPSEYGNVAVPRRPMGDAEWQQTLARMDDFYAGKAGGRYLVFSAWPTPDLTALGFGRIGHPPLMARVPAPLAVRTVEGLDIRPVTDGAGAEDWERTFIDGFPEPALQPVEPGCFLPAAAVAAVAADGWRFWVGYLDGRPVATASAWLPGTHVHVEYITTLATARGRGIGAAMTARATRVEPDLPAMLIASDLGRPVYARLGYRALTRFTLWAGPRRGTS